MALDDLSTSPKVQRIRALNSILESSASTLDRIRALTDLYFEFKGDTPGQDDFVRKIRELAS